MRDDELLVIYMKITILYLILQFLEFFSVFAVMFPETYHHTNVMIWLLTAAFHHNSTTNPGQWIGAQTRFGNLGAVTRNSQFMGPSEEIGIKLKSMGSF